MTILSKRTVTAVGRAYNREYGLYPIRVSVNGRHIPDRKRDNHLCENTALTRTRAYALQESIHWGEPYVFPVASSMISWIVPLVDGQAVVGGLVGGTVIPEGESPGTEQLVKELDSYGFDRETAIEFVKKLPVWPKQQIRDAAMFLNRVFYQVSGWKPDLLGENRLKSLQQRQIAEAMEEQKRSKKTPSHVDRERMLLYLIRAGDRNGARRVLNEMLAAMFMFSPELAVLRARAIEMMGYLTRTAVEDSTMLEPLIERNHKWMERIIKCADFETLSHVLMQALDDFMDGIYLHGFNRHNPAIGKAMNLISQDYAEHLTIEQIAAKVGLSASRLSHIVKEQTGKTVLQHIISLRVQKARELLDQTNKSCTEVAYEVGFCDQSYFIKQFRKITGTTPARYRRTRWKS